MILRYVPPVSPLSRRVHNLGLPSLYSPQLAPQMSDKRIYYRLRDKTYEDKPINNHIALTGITGHGKDAAEQRLVEQDYSCGKTAIVIGEIKGGDYITMCLPNRGGDFAKQLEDQKMNPRRFPVILHIPYTREWERSPIKNQLLNRSNPMLEVSPFKWHHEDISSHDAISLALAMESPLQRMLFSQAKQFVKQGESLTEKAMETLKEFADNRSKGFVSRLSMGESLSCFEFGTKSYDVPWDYLSLGQLLNDHKHVHVFSTAFSYETTNPEAGAFFNCALLCEIISATTNPARRYSRTVALHISEVGNLINDEYTGNMNTAAEYARTRLLKAVSILRGMGVELRINTQNLYNIRSSIVGQCSTKFFGRTDNQRDLEIMRKIGSLHPWEESRIRTLKHGEFFALPAREFVKFMPPASLKFGKGERLVDLLEEYRYAR